MEAGPIISPKTHHQPIDHIILILQFHIFNTIGTVPDVGYPITRHGLGIDYSYINYYFFYFEEVKLQA